MAGRLKFGNGFGIEKEKLNDGRVHLEAMIHLWLQKNTG